MVNDVIDELMDSDMEPKPESLQWTSTYREDQRTLKVGSRGENWDVPMVEDHDVSH